MSTRYSQGRAWEYRVKKHLEADGWLVMRSAGSKGIADLCALSGGRMPLLVSCRLHGKWTVAEKSKLLSTAHLAGAAARIAYRGEGGVVVELVW